MIILRIDDELKLKFQIACDDNNETMSDVIRRFIYEYLQK